MQHDQAEPTQDVLVHPLDDRIGDVTVPDVPPPEQHLGVGQRLLGQAVLGSADFFIEAASTVILLIIGIAVIAIPI